MSNAWQYYVLKGMSRMICLLPYSWVLALGNRIGKLYYRIASRQRQRALSQIQECLDMSAEIAEQTIESLCRKLGQTFLEVLYTPALTAEKIQDYVTIENRHYLDQAISDAAGWYCLPPILVIGSGWGQLWRWQVFLSRVSLSANRMISIPEF